MLAYRPLWYYNAFVTALALAGLAALDWTVVWNLSRADLVGVAALVALGVLSESLAITIVIGRHVGTSSITFLPLLASPLLFGPTVAVLFMAFTGTVTQILVHRKDAFTSRFNISQWIISTTLAGEAFELAGGTPASEGFDYHYLQAIALPFLLFGGILLGVNHLFVAGFIALKHRTRFRPVLAQLAGPSGTNLMYDLLVSPVALAIVFLYVELHVAGLILILLPLLLIRHSYLTSLRLQQANRDLLEMMVKAIETRDPYTSGHSRRVAVMARRVAELLRLPSRVAESIETAALLHDIGKIEADYTEIIRKPGQLSNEERRRIQAHATRGAELIKSLSSFKNDVVAAVHHHHERYDGRGYPDGLSGEAIPLGARIIMICDAVDAMLSDRPYRGALSVGDVQEQLQLGKGTQFDPWIISRLLRSDVLQKQCEEVLADRARSPEAVGGETRGAASLREFSVVQHGIGGG